MYPNCICGANDYKIVEYTHQDKKFSIIQCRKCFLARTWPKPIQSENKSDFYNEQEDYLERFSQLSLWENFVKKTLKNIRKVRSSGKLLDMGCNMGILVKEALNCGFDAYGMDISKGAIDFGKKQFGLEDRLSEGILEDAIKRNEKVDILVYVHVMEHIDNIIEELNNAKKILNKNGIIVIEVPNYKSLWRLIVGGRWYGFSPSQHIWQFSRKPLEKILKNSGYSIVYSSTRESLHHKINISVEGLIKIIIHSLSYIFNIGDSLVIIAQKNGS